MRRGPISELPDVDRSAHLAMSKGEAVGPCNEDAQEQLDRSLLDEFSELTEDSTCALPKWAGADFLPRFMESD